MIIETNTIERIMPKSAINGRLPNMNIHCDMDINQACNLFYEIERIYGIGKMDKWFRLLGYEINAIK